MRDTAIVGHRNFAIEHDVARLPTHATDARSWHASKEMAATATTLTKLLLPPISVRHPCCLSSLERI
jgi:hypothetical protein